MVRALNEIGFILKMTTYITVRNHFRISVRVNRKFLQHPRNGYEY